MSETQEMPDRELTIPDANQHFVGLTKPTGGDLWFFFKGRK
jgi:hypothetical protein